MSFFNNPFGNATAPPVSNVLPPVPARPRPAPPPTGGRRVLTIDGGGMRAVAILAFLELLEQRTQLRICQLFDMIVGTSTGGIVAVLLGVLRWPVADVRALYLKMGTTVFNVAEKGSLMTQGYYYSPEPLEKIFREVLAEKLMSDFPPLPGATPHVVIVANEIDMLPAKRVLFRNFGRDDACNLSKVPLWVALRATTAAPLYFPCVKFNGKHYIDGGMGNNNPVMTAVRESEALWGFDSIMCVCSVGTGQFPPRKNTFLVGESVGRSLLGSMNSGGMFSKLVSTAVSGASTVSLMQMLGELAVASDEQHYNAELVFRGMKIFYSRWDPEICAVELDCTDFKILQDLEATMITHTLEGERRQFFEHLCVLLREGTAG